MDTTRSPALLRAWYRTWLQLPYVRTGLVGSGVMAVNEAGSRRLGTVPEVLNDDAWVRRSFAESERMTTAGSYTVSAPRTVRAHLRRRARIDIGNRAMDGAMGGRDPGGNGLRALRALVAEHRASRGDAVAYAALTAAARLLARWRYLRGTTRTWSADRTTRDGRAAA